MEGDQVRSNERINEGGNGPGMCWARDCKRRVGGSISFLDARATDFRVETFTSFYTVVQSAVIAKPVGFVQLRATRAEP
jgi:hypothetical protein